MKRTMNLILFSIIEILIKMKMIANASATGDDVYGGSLASCQAFAATFNNTCADQSTQTSFMSLTG